MQLFGSDSNPVPDGAVVGSILASDGARLRVAHWRPVPGSPPRGTVCLFQGRAEAIEKYFEVIGELRQRGYAVATLDWRGQGGSERPLANPMKGHVDSFTQYDRDLDAFMEQVALPDCPPPHFALAHSTGALICLRAAHDGRARFARAVLVAPLFGIAPTRPSPEVGHKVAAFLTAFGLGEISVPERNAPPIIKLPFEGNVLTSDERRFLRNQAIFAEHPQIMIGPPTFSWLYAAGRAMQEANEAEYGLAVRVPILVLTAALDRVVSLKAIESVSAELRTGAQVVVAGSRHEMLMERDGVRAQFWAAFDAFVPGSPAVAAQAPASFSSASA
ncbi:MAG: alpha/beta hydrolase [Rhizobiales bacterium]|nr:alpha/beta hydrolase [Hyphomicrobiales bacterium]